MSVLNKILIDTPQELSQEQKDIASANIGAVRDHGTTTVDYLNELTSKQVGAMYTMGDAGKLTSFGSDLDVVEGDVVKMGEDGWHKFVTGGSSEVKHDDTLSGDGKTEETKLSVNEMVGAEHYADGGTVRIGEHDYHYVMVGNTLWITENLHEDIGAGSYWYNNDKSSYEAYGMLYKRNAVMEKDSITVEGVASSSYKEAFARILPEGWHIASSADYQSLRTYVGNDDSKLRSKSLWTGSGSSANGTDVLGLGFVPAGYKDWNSETAFYGIGKSAYLLCRNYTSYQGSNGVITYFGEGTSKSDNNYGTSIRLVKYVTDAGNDGKKGLVPQPKVDDYDKVLSGAGTWVDMPKEPTSLIKDANVSQDGKTLTLTKKDDTAVTFQGGLSEVKTDSATITGDGKTDDTKLAAKAMTGATSSNDGSAGIVPAPTKTDVNKVLSGAGTWVDMPEVPTKVSELDNDSEFLTSYTLPDVPTKVSELGNDRGFLEEVGDSKVYGRKKGAWVEIAGATEGQLTSAALVKVLNEFPTDGNYILSVSNGVPAWIGSKASRPTESVVTGFDRATMTFTDSRDGQVYPCVSIKGRIWMAAPFNYDIDEAIEYDGHPEYGKYYSKADALMYAPLGWELPTYQLTDSLDGLGVCDSSFGSGADNSTGLSLMPSGFYNEGAFVRTGGDTSPASSFWFAKNYDTTGAASAYSISTASLIDTNRHSSTSRHSLNDSTGLCPVRYVLKQKYLYL